MSELLIAFLGGALAGIINTLAGNGSAITLTIFTEVLGLPPNVANGTNRIGILAQSVTGTLTFHKHGHIPWSAVRPLLITFLPGALLGVIVATQISNEGFRMIFGILLTLLLIVILVKPKRWLQPDLFQLQFPVFLRPVLFFVLGFYGGFIQMGMGIFFLAAMVLIMHFNLTQSNGIKLLVVGTYTTFVLLIFHYKGLVDWQTGSVVAVSQGLFGWITARYASKYKWMEKVTYYLLVFIIVLALLVFYGWIPTFEANNG